MPRCGRDWGDPDGPHRYHGVPPYDGRYDFDLEGRELTTREWGWIKRLSGYLPLTIEEGFG